MTIRSHRGKGYDKAFDKRNDFGFEIINYPNIKGNIQRDPGYRLFISQFVRFFLSIKVFTTSKRISLL